MTLEFVEVPPKTKKAKSLVLLLHGYGSNERDLISLVPELGEGFDNTHFISVQAPFQHDSGFPGMYQWYSIQSRDDEYLFEGAKKAEPILKSFTEEQLERLKLKHNNLVVCGFSQGGMMTLHTFLRYPKKVAGIVSLSGYISGHKHLEKDITSKPSTLLIHGDMDDVVPPSSFEMAKKTLTKLEVPLEAHMLKGLSHGINYEAIRLTTKFLKNSLNVSS